MSDPKDNKDDKDDKKKKRRLEDRTEFFRDLWYSQEPLFKNRSYREYTLRFEVPKPSSTFINNRWNMLMENYFQRVNPIVMNTPPTCSNKLPELLNSSKNDDPNKRPELSKSGKNDDPNKRPGLSKSSKKDDHILSTGCRLLKSDVDGSKNSLKNYESEDEVIGGFFCSVDDKTKIKLERTDDFVVDNETPIDNQIATCSHKATDNRSPSKRSSNKFSSNPKPMKSKSKDDAFVDSQTPTGSRISIDGQIAACIHKAIDNRSPSKRSSNKFSSNPKPMKSKPKDNVTVDTTSSSPNIPVTHVTSDPISCSFGTAPIDLSALESKIDREHTISNRNTDSYKFLLSLDTSLRKLEGNGLLFEKCKLDIQKIIVDYLEKLNEK